MIVNENIGEVLANDVSVIPSVKVMALFNLNRYAGIFRIDNAGHSEETYGYDLKSFPISSIAGGFRPRNGVNKARVGQSKISGEGPSLVGGYVKRSVISTANDVYKYWSSPDTSSSSISAGSYSITNVNPYVVYDRLVYANRLLVRFENGWSIPTAFTLSITIDGTTWITVATNPPLNSFGEAIVYYNGTTWTTTPDYDNHTQIKGIRVSVTKINKASSRCDIVELAAGLEKDLSDRVSGVTTTMSMSDQDYISPLGILSSNAGTVSLSNLDNAFNNNIEDGIFYDLCYKYVEFSIDAGIDTSYRSGTGVEYQRLFTGLADTWGGNVSEETSVTLMDHALLLQETDCPEIFIQKASPAKIISRILNAVGFDRYNYVDSDDDDAPIVNYYWTDPSSTVWENINLLCRATQTAFYFDAYGYGQIINGKELLKIKDVAWTFTGQDSPKAVDIEELSIDETYMSNKVNISYSPTAPPKDKFGKETTDYIWEATDTVVLRSSPLRNALGVSDVSIELYGSDGTSWPYEGMVNINGEIISYKGKRYAYVDKSNVTRSKFIYSTEEKNNVDYKLTKLGKESFNYFTGGLKILERGLGDSAPQGHHVDLLSNGYSYRRFNKDTTGAVINTASYISKNGVEGCLRMSVPSAYDPSTVYIAQKNIDGPLKWWGTRLKFVSNSKSGQVSSEQCAGIGFNIQSNLKDGYYVDIAGTKWITDNKFPRGEIRVFRVSGGQSKWWDLQGKRFNIMNDTFYDIEVTKSAGIIVVYVNGVRAYQTEDPESDLDATGRFGPYVRGNSTVDFDYAYATGATGKKAVLEDADDSSFYDRISGGFMSDQPAKIKTPFHAAIYKKPTSKILNNKVFTEFIPVVHEIREFDIVFDKKPAKYSRPYFSNDYQTSIISYTHTPFRAKLVVVNSSRTNAILNGDDSKTFGADNVVTQAFKVVGVPIIVGEDQIVTVQDDDSIRANGVVSLDIASEFVQSETAAKIIGSWITDNWADRKDVISITGFFNPLLEIGDYVAVSYDNAGLEESKDRFWIIDINHSYDGGYTTEVKAVSALVD